MAKEKIRVQIKEQGLLPLFYHDDEVICVNVANTLYRAGVRIIEFTNRGQYALKNFKALVAAREHQMKNLLLAVGTIGNADDVNKFLDAGADFLISPFFNSSIADAIYLRKALWIPGCMTPTEMHVAQQAGCRMIKLFPGNLLGPSFVEAVKPLFPNIDFVVTGGVDTTEENLKAWFDAGVAGVGMGSKLISKAILKNKDYAVLERKTKEVISIISNIKEAQ